MVVEPIIKIVASFSLTNSNAEQTDAEPINTVEVSLDPRDLAIDLGSPTHQQVKPPAN